MNICLVISVIVIAFDDPFTDPKKKKVSPFHFLDIFTAVVFGLEIILKTIATGFFKTSLSGKYMECYVINPWNILDLLVEAA